MNTKIFYVIACLMILAVSTEVLAQRGRAGQAGPYQARQQPVGLAQPGICMGLDDLTPEQEASIRELQLKRMEQSLQHRNAMDELRARRRSLTTASDTDMAEVNRVIDQMAEKRAQWMKDNAAHRQEIRGLLTAEQRIIYDSQTSGRPAMRYMSRGEGRGRGPCMSPGRR